MAIIYSEKDLSLLWRPRRKLTELAPSVFMFCFLLFVKHGASTHYPDNLTMSNTRDRFTCRHSRRYNCITTAISISAFVAAHQDRTQKGGELSQFHLYYIALREFYVDLLITTNAT